MIEAANEMVQAEEMEHPGPCCVDAGSKCGLPEDTCSASVKMEHPGPCCVDAGSKCGLPEDTCSASVKMNMFQMVQSNLGGLGPDEGAEEIRFSKAAAINGNLVEIIKLVSQGLMARQGLERSGTST